MIIFGSLTLLYFSIFCSMNSDSLKQKIQGFLTKIKGLSRTQKMIILFVMVLVPAGIAISAFLILYFKGKKKR